ncbi:hypothetical protein BN975_04732 [Mycolicibacterium farcinogenes]|uniref:Uncharacterized protein n=1 Tax=Mycolicibacterium senegalense TaxID=1796 RepID=A0A378SYJ3_9MYCO|nr:hypothetical protein [Mycolicibacterium senegalense]CDP88889.1 hypothetical protein BN975_04732 [Mycolicibacterium farcinogenes]STZ53612.1 Uncharacterised protein [Mycolicibacterium senegalense]
MRRVQEHQHIVAGVSRRRFGQLRYDGYVLYVADVERADPSSP